MRGMAWVGWLWMLVSAAAAQEARLAVTLTDVDGQPAADVAVAVWSGPDRAAREALGGPAGRVSFEGLSAGRAAYSVRSTLYHQLYGSTTLTAGTNQLDLTLTPLTDAPDVATVEVLVIGRDGRPAANLEVEVDNRNDGPPPAPRRTWLGGLALALDGTELRQSGIMTTNAQGRIRFQAPPGWLHVCVTGRHELATGHDIWAPAGTITYTRAYLAEAAPAQAEPAQAEPQQEEDRRPTVRLEGRVLTPDGLPLAHTTVVVRPEQAEPRWWFGENGELTTVTTDAAGRFALDWPEELCPVQVKAAGWSASTTLEFEPKAMAPLDFRLTTPALRAGGRVLSAAGQPVPGAVVWAIPDEDGPAGGLDRLPTALPPGPPPGLSGLSATGLLGAACDADGRFAFDQLDAGKCRFAAAADGWGVPTIVERAADQLPGAPLALTLTPLAGLTGRVFRPDGRPWPNCPLTIVPEEADSYPMPVADGRGHYSLPGLPPGKRRYAFTLPGCQRIARELDLRPGETLTVDLRPGYGRVLTGRVLAADGQPAAFARLQSPPTEPGTTAWYGEMPRVAWTDAQGAFRLTGLRDGEQIIAIDTAFGTDPPQTVTLPHAAPLTLTLARRATVSGRVVDGQGQPLAGVVCRADSVGHAVQASAPTAADGRFVLAGLPAGDLRIVAERGDATVAYGQVKLAPGEQRTGLTLTASVPPASGPKTAVSGRVLAVDGQPASGASVHLDGADQPTLTTDAAGEYRLAERAAGPVRAWAEVDGCRSGEVRGTVRADTPLRLPDLRLLQRPVSGRLVDLPAGIEPRDCLVEPAVCAYDTQGQPLPERDGQLMPPAPSNGEDAPAARGSLPMVLSDFGYLLFPDAARVVGCQPRLMIDLAPRAVDADGRFTLPLPPGRQRLIARLRRPGGIEVPLAVVAEAEVDIPAGGPAIVILPAISGSAVLSGRLPTAAQALPALVAAYRPGSWTPAAVAAAGDDGVWRLTGLAAGEWRVMISGPGLGCRIAAASARDGQTTTVAAPADAGHTVTGRVRGKLPRTVIVTLESEAAVQSAAVTRDGRFRLEGLPAGSYRCRLWSGEANRLVRVPSMIAVPAAEVLLDW